VNCKPLVDILDFSQSLRCGESGKTISSALLSGGSADEKEKSGALRIVNELLTAAHASRTEELGMLDRNVKTRAAIVQGICSALNTHPIIVKFEKGRSRSRPLAGRLTNTPIRNRFPIVESQSVNDVLDASPKNLLVRRGHGWNFLVSRQRQYT
jgi:hypothetical protein